MREEARLKEADDADSHHVAVAKFMQKVSTNSVLLLVLPRCSCDDTLNTKSCSSIYTCCVLG